MRTDLQLRLMKVYLKLASAKTATAFRDQRYSDNNGEWRVGALLNFVARNKIPLSMLSVEMLADLNFEPSPNETGDEVPGSPEFVARAENSDLSFPLIVIEYPDGMFVADGVHRLWKARAAGMKKIKAHLLQSKDLLSIPQG